MKITLSIDYLLIDNYYYGGNQDWYNSYIKRLAGCGPTTASTITMYELNKNYSKKEFIKLMNDLWNYITPGMMGVDSVEKYQKGYDKYLKDNKLDISKSKVLYLDNSTIIDIENYLTEALNSNHPVAFLNLNNGSEKEIDSWHWTTIVSLEKISNNLFVEVCDEGYLKRINLSSWLETSGRGSFIYYY